MKHIFCLAFLLSLVVSSYSQIEKWTTVRFGELQCDFPKGYMPIQHSAASGVYFDGNNIYMTVTAQLDTCRMKGNLDREFTKDFMSVVLDVSRKLNGKVREYRDTVINNMPGYISKMEVSLPQEKKSYYELIQVIHGDSIRGFSAQYLTDDPHGIKASRRFFGSIVVKKGAARKAESRNLGIWLGGAVLLAAVLYLFMKRSVAPKTRKA